MSWDSDWLDFEVGLYQESLRRRVRAAYHAAHKVLEDEYRRGKEKLEQDLKQQRDEEDDPNWGFQILAYEDERWLEQREALAAMALTLLASLTKSFLDEQKGRNLNKTHPPDAKEGIWRKERVAVS